MKRIFTFAILVAAISLFVACPTTPPPAEEPPPPPPPEVVGHGDGPVIPETPVEVDLLAAYRDHYSGLILKGATTYTVRSGDTMSSIAWDLYDDGFFYPIIMLASHRVVLDPDRIQPGMELTVPNLETNLNDQTARANIRNFLLEIAGIEEARGRSATAAGIRERAEAL